jgi:hypothetical protein
MALTGVNNLASSAGGGGGAPNPTLLEVADIAARNAIAALDRFQGMRVLVIDASADANVGTGRAFYQLGVGLGNGDWLRVSEEESMDLTFDGLSPTTTKGDLIVRNASNNIRLPVGADGQIPIADSGEAAGIKWDTALPNAVEDTFTPTLSQTIFTLSSTPSGPAAFSLYLNGQLRLRGTDYTQAGTILTWLDPGGLTLLTTDELIARYNDTALAGVGKPIAYINELQLEPNSSNPTFQIDIATGSCRNDSDDGDIVATPITVDLTVSGIDGLDTGSEASDTWYFVWLIKHTDGTVSGLLSLSSTSPTLPAGYTKKRRLGSIRNDTGSDIIPFAQNGKANRRTYSYLSIITSRQPLSGGSSEPIAAVDLSSFVPPTTQTANIFANQGGTVAALLLLRDVGGAAIELLSSGQASSYNDFPITSSQTMAYTNFGVGGLSDIYVRGYTEGI